MTARDPAQIKPGQAALTAAPHSLAAAPDGLAASPAGLAAAPPDLDLVAEKPSAHGMVTVRGDTQRRSSLLVRRVALAGALGGLAGAVFGYAVGTLRRSLIAEPPSPRRHHRTVLKGQKP